MFKVKITNTNRIKRKLRVRKKVFGTAEMPRLTVFKSNKYTYGQVINDTERKTLVSIFAEAPALHKSKNKVDAAFLAGEKIGEKCVKAGIKKVVFDRDGYRYHGRVKSFADGARKAGLEF